MSKLLRFNQTGASLLERYQATMVLHAVGDALGFFNNKWEPNTSGPDIHRQLKEMGDLESLNVNPVDWRVSDDTIFHLANAEFIVNELKETGSSLRQYQKLAGYYVKAMDDMENRYAGKTTIEAINRIKTSNHTEYRSPFNPRGGGCGVSMRSACIGLRFSRPEQLDQLIEFSIESGRITHHNPMGYLGGLLAALFTSYAIQNNPIVSWGHDSLAVLERSKSYISNSGYFVEENLNAWNSFVEPLKKYLALRCIENGQGEARFPPNHDDAEQRDIFYKTIADREWAGSSGVDSVLIAYDALLASQGDWRELCYRAMLHGGDNDSTGCIAGSWYGALYGFAGVPKNLYKDLEYLQRLKDIGLRIYAIQYVEQNN